MVIKIPDIKLVDPQLLKADGKNPNKMTNAEEQALENNIKRYGFLVPVITNKDFLIADGEQRWHTACRLNIPEIPVIALPVNEVDRRILRQVMNKLKGEHDEAMDLEEFKAILAQEDKSILKELLAMADEDSQHILDSLNPVGEDNFEMPDIDRVKTKIKLGDLIQLGNHRLMCGDSTKEEDVKKLMGGAVADMVFTDPPYGISIVKANGKIGFGNGRLGFHNKATGTIRGSIGGGGIVPVGRHKFIQGDDKSFNPESLLKIGKNQIIWGANYFADKLPISSCWLIWDKRIDIPSNNFADCELAWTSFKKPSRIYRQKWSGLIREGERETELDKRIHPTQKPVRLHSEILQDYSREKELILDLYAGSGTTLIACEQLNRICYMCEIDPVYCQVIINRWEKFTNAKAKKIQ